MTLIHKAPTLWDLSVIFSLSIAGTMSLNVWTQDVPQANTSSQTGTLDLLRGPRNIFLLDSTKFPNFRKPLYRLPD